MRLLSVVALIILSPFVHGQIAFHKLYSNNGYDFGQGVVQLEDSSYVICGSSSSFTDGPSQAFLLHVDAEGNYLWSNHYGGSESDGAKRVAYIPQNGFIAAGFSNSFGEGAYDAYAFRTDLSGGLIWETTVGGAGWERINDAVMTADTGLLMVGQSNSTVNGDNDMFLVRISSSGDTLWTKKIGGAGEDIAHAIVALTDSTFAVGGEYFLADSNQVKGYVFALHLNGTVLWADTVLTVGASSVIDLDADLTGNRIHFVGWRFNPNASIENNLFGKYFLNGALDFYDSEPTNDFKRVDQITRFGTQGKNYMVYRYIDGSSFQDGSDIGVSKLMSNLYWDGFVQSINYPMDDVPGQIIPTNDGGAILVGSTSGMGLGGGNVFAMKIGPNDLFPVIEPDPVPNSLVDLIEWDAMSLKIYPVPTNDKLYIEQNSAQKMSYQLVDLNGKNLMNVEVVGNSELDISMLDAGMYLLYVSDDRQFNTKVIRIQKF